MHLDAHTVKRARLYRGLRVCPSNSDATRGVTSLCPGPPSRPSEAALTEATWDATSENVSSGPAGLLPILFLLKAADAPTINASSRSRSAHA